VARGFDAVKFAASVADQGSLAELRALREGLGPDVAIGVDLHWQYEAAETVRLARLMEPYAPWFLEAPVRPEDIEGQAFVAERIGMPLALGEEWRTVHEALPRFKRRAVAILQPEMGHTGITQFMRLAQLAQAHGVRVIPHATIGLGIFLAASLQASSSILDLPAHEFQHSIMERNQRYLTGGLRCEAGFYEVPDGPGLGVAPNEEALALMGAT
jgi:D-galactarolactone cycloisomerase